MLVLTRKSGESIKVGDNITIKVISIKPNRVRLGVDAPDGVRIQRAETLKEKEKP